MSLLETAGISAIIAAVIAALFPFLSSRKHDKLQYITDERKKFREDIRKIAEELYGASYSKTLKILVKLKVRINAFGIAKNETDIEKDAHIWDLINYIENNSKISDEKLNKCQKQLIEYLTLYIKIDWDKSKNEVIGQPFNVGGAFITICAQLFYVGLCIYSVITNEKTNNSTGLLLTLTMITVLLIFNIIWIVVKNKIGFAFSLKRIKIIKYLNILLMIIVELLCAIAFIKTIIGFNNYIDWEEQDIALAVDIVVSILYCVGAFVRFMPVYNRIQYRASYAEMLKIVHSNYEIKT